MDGPLTEFRDSLRLPVLSCGFYTVSRMSISAIGEVLVYIHSAYNNCRIGGNVKGTAGYHHHGLHGLLYSPCVECGWSPLAGEYVYELEVDNVTCQKKLHRMLLLFV